MDSLLDDVADEFDFSGSDTVSQADSLQSLVSRLPSVQYNIAGNFGNKQSPLGIFGGPVARHAIKNGIPPCPQCFLMIPDKALAGFITKRVIDDLQFIKSHENDNVVLSAELKHVAGFVTPAMRKLAQSNGVDDEL